MQSQARVANVLHRKMKIPKALREQVWISQMGHVFSGKCKVTWCQNKMSVFDFQCGHNIPESRGGKTDVTNLIPICARCNQSMGDMFTIDEWNSKFAPPPPAKLGWKYYGCCFNSKV